MFYLLSFVTGILECGWIFYGVSLGLPLWAILVFPLAYHLGNMFPKPFSVGRKIVLGAAITASLLAVSLVIIPLGNTASLICQGCCIALLSMCIQSARSGMKSDDNRVLKRVSRTLGFAAAPIVTLTPNIVLIAAAVFALICVKSVSDEKPHIVKMHSQGGFSAAMILHQLHYFFYAHITLAAVAFVNRYAAILFALSWVIYLTVEPIATKFKRYKIGDFALSHLWIAAVLFSMSFLKPGTWFYSLWLAAGLGGGMVFCITLTSKTLGCFAKDSNDVAENIGHFAGLLCAVICALLFADRSVAIMQVSAAISALCVIPAMVISAMRMVLKK